MLPVESKIANPLVVILGPTASGKTKLAVSVSAALDAEIISADSRQVFRGMDIGTGKDLTEYNYHGINIPYHLIDIKDAGERYHVDEFKNDFFEVFQQLTRRKKLPLLCGGTGMYIHSVLQNHAYTSIPVDLDLRSTLLVKTQQELNTVLDQFALENTEHADRSTRKRLIRAIEVATFLASNKLELVPRPEISPYIIGLYDDVGTRREKIHKRLERRLDEGMIEEVAGLLESGVSAEMLCFYGLEYKIVVSYLKHQVSYADMKTQLYNGICQYAKRQMTFFRKMEKDGVNIHWYQADIDPENLREQVLNDIKSNFFDIKTT
ncbi:tRNA (adenosine(37)-N6)-dimethylallyltransferase MiaA [Pedobacter sp. SAFR-022]|uniref:tRNA (adenosine(37)-N6)-dimethylallyltransferase MiaA n=1 Tax=Pedobacter sp. SAFR-022 TaxID=3436861 RepID=UPI003F7FEB9F